MFHSKRLQKVYHDDPLCNKYLITKLFYCAKSSHDIHDLRIKNTTLITYINPFPIIVFFSKHVGCLIPQRHARLGNKSRERRCRIPNEDIRHNGQRYIPSHPTRLIGNQTNIRSNVWICKQVLQYLWPLMISDKQNGMLQHSPRFQYRLHVFGSHVQRGHRIATDVFRNAPHKFQTRLSLQRSTVHHRIHRGVLLVAEYRLEDRAHVIHGFLAHI
mmetsp:Transcript_3965/g.6254  ORF Transcript_3965/g.6254 Transcript_3965/m.6254 type:complete len:215 (-) Transcript_3965:328-972(-)